ncbi:M67 family metallopeptidase [Paenibacillus sp. PR3]|uniref:M67 family metallopeptidase n=1 Tax=Paenibacillus terricola TaxID=2763503 RepID=A0ABR8MU95_9BACL|nr:M67 family metallopeptidase [Paenibacillus terricola]MBD3919535.1 M67 family metallopeptidase [Paenibacillus terricola]
MTMKNNSPSYRLTSNAYEQLVTHCRSAYPNEACGLLIISSSDTHTVIDTIHPIANVHPNPYNCFSFDPSEWISALYQIEQHQQLLIGYYHSHPRSLPIPSTADSIGMLPQTGAITLIVSFFTSKPDIRAYRKCSEGWQQIELLMDNANSQ